jgi:UDP-N-acetylglucosamine 4-epimerase
VTIRPAHGSHAESYTVLSHHDDIGAGWARTGSTGSVPGSDEQRAKTVPTIHEMEGASREMPTYEALQERIKAQTNTWLITGVAGFIGSNLLEALLKLNQRVIGLDNFAAGRPENLAEVRDAVGTSRWKQFRFIEGDIRDPGDCREACRSARYVLHEAALGSVPASVEDPVSYNESNIGGFLNVLVAARDAGVTRFVYAGSSATYGDDPGLPKREESIGNPLSPYGLTKCVNELYAGLFARCYEFDSIGLRYFNVFGPRQDPNGAYAAVIPQWIGSMLNGESVYINGDGETSRDFCHVDNVVQANLLAATCEDEAAVNQVYNVALGEKTTLNELFQIIRQALEPRYPSLRNARPVYREFRAGDVRLSQADIDKARRLLGYRPTRRVEEGLMCAIEWYAGRARVQWSADSGLSTILGGERTCVGSYS